MKKPLQWMSVVSVSIAAVKLLIGGVVVTWEGRSFAFGPPDAGAFAALLGPVLAAYASTFHRSMRPPEDKTP